MIGSVCSAVHSQLDTNKHMSSQINHSHLCKLGGVLIHVKDQIILRKSHLGTGITATQSNGVTYFYNECTYEKSFWLCFA